MPETKPVEILVTDESYHGEHKLRYLCENNKCKHTIILPIKYYLKQGTTKYQKQDNISKTTKIIDFEIELIRAVQCKECNFIYEIIMQHELLHSNSKDGRYNSIHKNKNKNWCVNYHVFPGRNDAIKNTIEDIFQKVAFIPIGIRDEF